MHLFHITKNLFNLNLFELFIVFQKNFLLRNAKRSFLTCLHSLGWIVQIMFTIYRKHTNFPIFIIFKVDKIIRTEENVDFGH